MEVERTIPARLYAIKKSKKDKFPCFGIPYSHFFINFPARKIEHVLKGVYSFFEKENKYGNMTV